MNFPCGIFLSFAANSVTGRQKFHILQSPPFFIDSSCLDLPREYLSLSDRSNFVILVWESIIKHSRPVHIRCPQFLPSSRLAFKWRKWLPRPEIEYGISKVILIIDYLISFLIFLATIYVLNEIFKKFHVIENRKNMRNYCRILKIYT